MKITELLSKLNKLLEECGDLEVRLEDADRGDYCNINKFAIYKKELLLLIISDIEDDEEIKNGNLIIYKNLSA